jgi:hypothetical protein
VPSAPINRVKKSAMSVNTAMKNDLKAALFYISTSLTIFPNQNCHANYLFYVAVAGKFQMMGRFVLYILGTLA